MKSVVDILGVEIEKYEEINDPTNIEQKTTDWTIYEIDLKKIREMKRNTTKSKKRKKSLTELAKPELEIELSCNDNILKPFKISKLDNIDNILK